MKKIQIYFENEKLLSLLNIQMQIGITGLYFISNKDIEIRYPFKSSRLIYIGMSEKKSNSIGNRLIRHLDGSSKNKGISNYLITNSLLYTYINFEMLKKVWPYSIESLENYFILNFVEHYGVYPICNNKSSLNFLKNEKELLFNIDWSFFEK
ncbi:TPA: hypothetical protein ACJT8N_002057 [Legionella pneumophila]